MVNSCLWWQQKCESKTAVGIQSRNFLLRNSLQQLQNPQALLIAPSHQKDPPWEGTIRLTRACFFFFCLYTSPWRTLELDKHFRRLKHGTFQNLISLWCILFHLINWSPIALICDTISGKKSGPWPDRRILPGERICHDNSHRSPWYGRLSHL